MEHLLNEGWREKSEEDWKRPNGDLFLGSGSTLGGSGSTLGGSGVALMLTNRIAVRFVQSILFYMA